MIPQIKKILYATDLSKNSSYAFLYAVEMAKKYDAGIVVLHAFEPTSKEVRFVDVLERVEKKESEGMLEKMKELLVEFCRKTEAFIGPPCTELVSKILVPRGYPSEEILKAADEEGCDVIVVGSHGKGWLTHTFLGSVSSSVLQGTRKPVLVIPLPSDKIAMEWDGA
jgi:nucleotide-binding universal stress UspA family protein